MIVDQERVPFCLLGVTDQMMGCSVPFVINKVKLVCGKQREPCHLGFIKHPAVFVFYAMAKFRRSEIGDKVQLSFFTLLRGKILDFSLAFLQFVDGLLLPDCQEDDRQQDHCADRHSVDADAVTGCNVVRISGIITDFNCAAFFIGRTIGIQYIRIFFAACGISGCNDIRIIIGSGFRILLNGYDRCRRLFIICRLYKRRIYPKCQRNNGYHRSEGFKSGSF